MFPDKRYVLDVDYRWIDEVPLESLEACQGFICKGLWWSKWKRIYLVIPREQWTDDDYFVFATKRIKELGMNNP